MVDLEGKIRTVNRATSELLGYADEEILGRSIETIFKSEDISQSWRGGENFTFSKASFSDDFDGNALSPPAVGSPTSFL